VPAEAAEATGTEDDDDDDCELVVPLSPLEPLLSHPAPAAPAAAAPAAAAVAAPTKVVAGRGYPVFISLSGGVDSMVIAKILTVLRARRHAPPTATTATAANTGAALPIGPIVAAHIDYANRAESSREAAYVRTWCEEMDIEFRCRVVDEVRGWVRASGLF
jgi:hypothetical protein